MRLLLTNDDGFDAPGLAALWQASEGLGQRTIVAPDRCHSCAGHGITVHRPIRHARRNENGFATDGTPADCVRLGLHGLVERPDVVLSGINAGGNLGVDVYHSGTVAAAREAVFHGLTGVALSYYRAAGHEFDWVSAGVRAAKALRFVLSKPPQGGFVWNINLPSLAPGDLEPEIVECLHHSSPLPVSFQQDASGAFIYRGEYHRRQRPPQGDVAACFGGAIAISRIPV